MFLMSFATGAAAGTLTFEARAMDSIFLRRLRRRTQQTIPARLLSCLRAPVHLARSSRCTQTRLCSVGSRDLSLKPKRAMASRANPSSTFHRRFLFTQQLKSINSRRRRLRRSSKENSPIWAEVGGSDLRIKVVRREDADSTVGVLRASMPGFKNFVFAAKSKTAVTTQDAIETAQQVEGAIAFAPYSPALRSTVTVLKIDGLFPTDDLYPCKGTVSLAFKPSTVTAEAKTFMAFAADSPKAHQLMEDFGGVPVRKD